MYLSISLPPLSFVYILIIGHEVFNYNETESDFTFEVHLFPVFTLPHTQLHKTLLSSVL